MTCRCRPAPKSCWKGISIPDETERVEGPFGDHTGYYNEQETFPVFTVERITMRRDPIYHSTYTGKPPDEPAMLGVALNEVFVPLLQKQFTEIVDFYLPPEGCSYRMAVVQHEKAVRRPRQARDVRRVELPAPVHVHQIHRRDRRRRQYPRLEGSDLGHHHARRSGARHADRRQHADRLSRLRRPVSGLGGKMGIDATNKWPGETNREWGTPIAMDKAVKERVDEIWKDLGL